jgi:hypothetical protein
LQARTSVGRPFEYSYDFDENGIIYWLATGRKKSPWKNPALTGVIKIVASSIEKGKVIIHVKIIIIIEMFYYLWS